MAIERLLLSTHQSEPEFISALLDSLQSTLKAIRARHFFIISDAVAKETLFGRTATKFLAKEYIGDASVSKALSQCILIELWQESRPWARSHVSDSGNAGILQQSQKVLVRMG
jgi:hypothetical protein